MSDKVEIKYTDSGLTAQFGAGVHLVTRAFAEKRIAEGKAKYANPIMNTNPTIEVSEEELQQIKKRYSRNKFMSEESFISEICWVTGSQVSQELLKAGFDSGFDVKLLTPNSFSSGDIIKTPFVILSSNLDHFSQIQLSQLKILLFQKKIPYAYRISELCPNQDLSWVRHCVNMSILNFYESEDVYNECLDKIGPQVKKRRYIENKPMQFWRKINILMKKVK